MPDALFGLVEIEETTNIVGLDVGQSFHGEIRTRAAGYKDLDGTVA